MISTITFVLFHLGKEMCLNHVQMNTRVHLKCPKSGLNILKIFKSQTCGLGSTDLGARQMKKVENCFFHDHGRYVNRFDIVILILGMILFKGESKKRSFFPVEKNSFFPMELFLWFLQKMVFHKAQRSKGRTLFYFSFLAIQK